MLKRLGSDRAYLPLLVGLLVLTFLLTAVVAYQAQDADLQHREAAEAALHDYTEVAAEQWWTLFQGATMNGLQGVYVAARRTALLDGPDVPTAERLAQALTDTMLCRCVSAEHIAGRMYFDASTRSIVSAGRPLSAPEAARFWQAFEGPALARVASGWSGAWVVLDDTDEPVIVTAMAETGETGEPMRGVGYVLHPAAIAAIADFIYGEHPLFLGQSPNAQPNSALFAVRVETANGAVVYGASGLPDGPTARRTVPPIFGGFDVTVGLKAGAADLLVPGGMPTPRLPFLLVVLAITGASVIAALFVLRQEAELMRLRSDFVSGVSHELRTPLAQIRMFTETLLLGRVRSDIERRRALEIIDQEARRLAQLVENVLTFGRSTQRRARVAPEPAALPAELRGIVESFPVLRHAAGVDVRLELQDGIVVPVDRDALRQIVLNLVDNALKYGPAGQRITVGCALFGDAARLWVDDEGPGVPVADREGVFDSFHRLSRDVERAVTGSGIGLAVVRELTRLHGGSAWIEDAPGGGARVVVAFPGAYVRGTDTAEEWAVA